MTTSLEVVTRANALLSSLRFSEAEQYLQKAAASGSADAFTGLGRLAIMNGRADDAREMLGRALSLQSGHAEALALQGVCWMLQGRYDLAIEILEQARVADPRLSMVYLNLGHCHCELGQFPQAEEHLRKAIELSPDRFEAHARLSYLLMQTGRLTQGIHAMLRAIRINPRYIKGYLTLGALYERAGKRDLVVRLYRSGIEQNPEAYLLRISLCDLYVRSRDFPSAYREALEIARRRNSYLDYLRLGSYAVALQQFETAEEAFETSLRLNPESWEGHYNLGELYMSARMMDRAREQYQAALDLGPDRYEALNGMGLFVLMVDHDWNAAIAFLNRAVEVAPMRPAPRLNLALAYAKKRDYVAAQSFVASVLALTRPGDPIYDQADRLQGTIRLEARAFQSLK